MSSIAHPSPPATNRFNLRALIAGGTATTSLVAATLIAFLSLAVYVGFDGLPIGGGAGSGEAISLGPAVAGAPEDAAAAAAGVPGAVAGAPATATAVAAAPGAVAPAGPTTTTGPGDDGTPPGGTPPGGGNLVGSPPEPGPGPAPGALGGTVSNLEATTDPVVDLPLTDVTDGVTGPVDQGVNQALNDVGGVLGNPRLGDQVSDGVNELGDRLLGPGGATDQLLP